MAKSSKKERGVSYVIGWCFIVLYIITVIVVGGVHVYYFVQEQESGAGHAWDAVMAGFMRLLSPTSHLVFNLLINGFLVVFGVLVWVGVIVLMICMIPVLLVLLVGATAFKMDPIAATVLFAVAAVSFCIWLARRAA